jgi:hypothetical protein
MNLPIATANADATFFSYGATHKKEKLSLPRKKDTHPIRALLVGGVHVDLFVNQPLPITIETDDDGTIVIGDDIFLVYGYGENSLDALNDYAASLIEFYWILESGAKENPFDSKQFTYLQSFIQPKSQRGYNNALQTTRD